MLAGLGIAAVVSAQDAAPPEPPTAFQSASVTPSRAGQMSVTADDIGDRLRISRLTLKSLVGIAYGVGDDQVSGGPAWIDSEAFDIDAKTADPASRELKMVLLRALLENTFQLKLHKETRDQLAYALVVAKDGPKVQPIEESELEERSKAGPSNQVLWTMGVLANMLSRTLAAQHIPVVDQTNMEGIYDVTAFAGAVNGSKSVEALQAALAGQLGLALEKRQTTVDIFVVDHAEKASAK